MFTRSRKRKIETENCELNSTFEKTRKRRSLKPESVTVPGKIETENGKLNSTFEKTTQHSETIPGKIETENCKLNSKFEKTRQHRSLKPESVTVPGKVEPVNCKLNSTFEKTRQRRSLKPESVTVPGKVEPVNCKLNSTFEKTRECRSLKPESVTVPRNIETENGKKPESVTVPGKIETENGKKPESESLNATFEKANKNTKTVSLDLTFDKETGNKLNTTFDINEAQNQPNSSKSSLISSENTINVTSDKSDTSGISITSDESRTENGVDTTALLIESSLEVSKTSDYLFTTENFNTSQKGNKKESLPEPVTPLIREGTFTKDGPDVIFIMSPKPKLSSERTPLRNMSLPSPGFTPFYATRSSQRDKSALNVTRSIEKSTRRSSLADLAPRQTKVMFCSPMNSPGVVTQQKKKIIKSSLKGSNKSFVFDESVSDTRRANRKRSLTHEATLTRAKRSRLAEGQQLSVERLSRPRTSSAAAKLTDNTPKKDTPVKAKPSRTKLPNFAALHKREFGRMESLDECQQRKARRAKELLTPKGKSTRGTTEKVASARSAGASTKDIEKPETPANAQTISKHTLQSLRPGFTRFGFKMHVDGNPFSAPNKTETKAKENRPNGLTRKAASPLLPSTKGYTVRKETAKQMIMREKTFTSLSNKREVKRAEQRTIIKGVRTNRRFELQMQMRNIN